MQAIYEDERTYRAGNSALQVVLADAWANNFLARAQELGFTVAGDIVLWQGPPELQAAKFEELMGRAS